LRTTVCFHATAGEAIGKKRIHAVGRVGAIVGQDLFAQRVAQDRALGSPYRHRLRHHGHGQPADGFVAQYTRRLQRQRVQRAYSIQA
jgi:hypothetical protein